MDLSAAGLRNKVKGLSPLVGPVYVRSRRLVSPVIGPALGRFRHRGLLPGDCFVASYPRSGSTWLRFLLFELATGRDPTFEEMRNAMPYVTGSRHAVPLLPGSSGNRRLLQTHERYCDYYSEGLVVYLVRDVRDVAMSEYQWRLRNGTYRRSFDHFLDDFVGGKLRFGSWQEHVSEWLDS